MLKKFEIKARQDLYPKNEEFFIENAVEKFHNAVARGNVYCLATLSTTPKNAEEFLDGSRSYFNFDLDKEGADELFTFMISELVAHFAYEGNLDVEDLLEKISERVKWFNLEDSENENDNGVA